MHRTLKALVLVQAVVIALLLYLYLTKEERPRAGAPGSVTTVHEETRVEAPATSTEPDAEPAEVPADPAESWTLVHGEIKDETGKPVDPCWITAQGPGTQRHVSALQGHYAIPGLVPGTWTLHIRTPSGAAMEASVELRQGSNRDDIVFKTPVQIRIVAETPEGKSLAKEIQRRGVRVFGSPVSAVATRSPPKALPMTDLRNHGSFFGVGAFRGPMDGGVKLGPNEIGVLTLKEDPPVFVSLVLKHVVLETREVRSPVKQLRFTVAVDDVLDRMPTVKMRFVDAETGEPIRPRVDIHDRQSRSGGRQADEKGYLAWENAPPGLMLLRVDSGQWESMHHRIRIPDAKEHDLGTFRLHKAVTVTGRILDGDGKPLQTRLAVTNLDRLAFPQALDTGGAVLSQADGTFTLGGAGRARYLVLAQQNGWARKAVIVDTTGGAVEDVEIRLERGVKVTLKPDPAPAEHPLLTVRDADGLILLAKKVRGAWPVAFEVVPGSYRVEVADDNGIRKTIPLDVGSEPVELEIDP